jgi:hypothetical protein
VRTLFILAAIATGLAQRAQAQDVMYDNWDGASMGAGASLGAQEALYPFDDQEPWKHGYRQVMPYYGGWHSFRPYNYHHVFGQTQAAAAWGMPLPYSQQFWHRYQAVPGGNVVPFPQPGQAAAPWAPPSFPDAGMMPPAVPPAMPPAEPAPHSYGPAPNPVPAPLPAN